MKENTCCIIGYCEIDITNKLILRLKAEIYSLASKGVNRFIFGSRSDLDPVCHDIITEIQKNNPDIKRIAYDCELEQSVYEKDRIAAEREYFYEHHEKVRLLGYDEIVKTPTIIAPFKTVFGMRNNKMIDDAEYCIFYYNKSAIKRPVRIEEYSNQSLLLSLVETEHAYYYAVRNNKKIINVFE